MRLQLQKGMCPVLVLRSGYSLSREARKEATQVVLLGLIPVSSHRICVEVHEGEMSSDPERSAQTSLKFKWVIALSIYINN
jgi:hypothetical protein